MSESVDPSDYFANLGKQIALRWRDAQHETSCFAEIAETVVSADPPSNHISFWDTLKLAFFREPLPYQVDIEATFGQPPLTVYWQHEFRIELLFWVEGMPGIHQHSFSGAFHVMHGSSLHTEWKFESSDRVSTGLCVGALYPKKTELLVKGDVRRIVAGPEFIHSTYHVDRPSISVVVRTNREEDHLPQYQYYPPGIAIARDITPTIQRRIQLLRMLARANRRDELIELILHFTEISDPIEMFYFLLNLYPLFRSDIDRNRIIASASRRHPLLTSRLARTLTIRDQHQCLFQLRERVTNPDLQFFLGLLLVIQNARQIVDVIAARYNGVSDPIDRIVGWLEDLSESGLVQFRFPSFWQIVLRQLLGAADDTSATFEPLSEADIAACVDMFRQHYLLASLFYDPVFEGSKKEAPWSLQKKSVEVGNSTIV